MSWKLAVTNPTTFLRWPRSARVTSHTPCKWQRSVYVWGHILRNLSSNAKPIDKAEATASGSSKHEEASSTVQGGAGDDDNADFEGDFVEEEDGEEEWQEEDDDAEEARGADINTGNVAWGEVALHVARRVLSESPACADLELFSLKAISSRKRLDIRLDKLSDVYGSPLLEDIEHFSRAFISEFEASLGEAAAGDIEVEVSSPGAERELQVPTDLARFSALPMKVEFINAHQKVDTRVFNFESYNESEGSTVWRLANVRVNRQGKGGGLSRKAQQQQVPLPVQSIRRVNLYIDI